MAYFVIISDADGVGIYKCKDAQTAVRYLEDAGENCVDDVPDDDLNCWGDACVVIKGEIVVPKPVKSVTEWKLP